MSKKIKSLEKYTKAMRAIADYREANTEVFDEYDSLLVKAQDAEAELKADVKENHKMNIANDFIKVSYSPAFKKGYKADVILKKVSSKVKKTLIEMGAIVVKEETDKDKIEEAVEKGIVPVKLRQEAYFEEKLTPRVTIKEVKNEQEKENK